MTHLSRLQRIEAALQVFDPIDVRVTNQSAAHHGHAGDDGSGETHFHIFLMSARFDGLSRVARQRLVMDALGSEFSEGLHALSMDLKGSDL